jgi:cysteinyl-tRNA synthetase
MSEMQGLVIYDDMEKWPRLFEPLNGNRINMYVCGVTVYGPCHIGHARAYTAFDAARRYLEYKGYDVNYIQNFTDVDDKIIDRAKSEGRDIRDISERYIAEYFRDMDALGIKRATEYPRATEFIPEMIDLIKTLIDKGHAYESDGNVFYSVEKFERYGRLSGRDTKDELPIQEPAPGKRNPADFALWKKSGPDTPGWDSPFGRGRPGWHIECSAMSLKLAGGTLDIHGGGEDLIFPHHENEIAQSEAATGAQFVRFWMHNGFIQIDKEKMSKSLGNVLNVKDVLEKYSPEALRLLFLGAHYRMPLNFSFERLDESEKALDRFRSYFDALDRLRARADEGLAPGGETAAAAAELETAAAAAQRDFEKAMDDDFNTTAAVAQLFTIVRKANAFMSSLDLSHPDKAPGAAAQTLHNVNKSLLFLAGVLGLGLEKVRAARTADSGAEEKLMRVIIETRARAREQKNWALADFIRDSLADAGYVIEDRPTGADWKKK